MDRSNSRIPNHDTTPHYCGHCLTPVSARSASCPACDLSFAGPGRFQRLPGSPPAPLGVALFDFAA